LIENEVALLSILIEESKVDIENPKIGETEVRRIIDNCAASLHVSNISEIS
jgi:hypothetical protein